jgi:nucleoid DNA-binding protein
MRHKHTSSAANAVVCDRWKEPRIATTACATAFFPDDGDELHRQWGLRIAPATALRPGGRTAMAKAAKKAGSKPRSKSEVYSAIAETAGLARKQVAAVFDELANLIKKDLNKGAGIFAVPGLMKIMVVRKPATKARKGINPFTKEEVMFKAKPARKVVKVRPLKNLKEMVS